ncbi:MAG: hypothetical protein A2Y62_14545 [Candidatus Fischerbacteria bacterium RBG_13_37_8]|uniref:Amine oxidase domain-containing protein n=1 Tax=Candidatus Fischerbacteria bacterium RBG_13_37_8 TaxID=1817863 RepID=A0A1F5V5B6_9BACT|nr:MAG: hypothetical protein A2Y62_14545 [Candidatus Fischerbacteria bacterium RBG_13_37_8]
MKKQIIVIGAGVAGLSAGCYGQMNGYDVQIFEKDTQPGGLCTSWQRQGYTINGGLAMLAGSGPASSFYRLWQDLGVVPAIRMLDYECMIIVEGSAGKKLCLYNDVDRLHKHLLELAPEDKEIIDPFIKAIRTFSKYNLPIEKPQELMTFFDKMKMMLTHFPLIKAMTHWRKVPVIKFIESLKNPFLREAFYQARALFPDNLPMAALEMFLAWGNIKAAGFPEGGALKFARAMERRFLELGGIIHYNSRVEKVLVENGKAVGVKLAGGEAEHADFVISAADGHSTIFNMLEGKFINDRIRHIYDDYPVGPAVVMVALGVSRLFEELPHAAFGIVFKLPKMITIGGIEQQWLRPMIYNYDPSLSPPGKTLIRFVLPAEYDYWKVLSQDNARYQSEKKAIADKVVTLLELRFPGISKQVEILDVATPLTFERYTGNWRGSILGWDATTETFFMPLPKQLPGLENFYMAGHWVNPGAGVPGSALSGRAAIQHIKGGVVP